MTPEQQYRRETNILSRVLDAPEEERTRIIGELCGGDASLEDRITQLLQAHRDSATIWQASPAELLVSLEGGAILAGRFRLGRKLGEGGMGEVWSAFDLHHPDERIAVKLIRPEFSAQPTIIARFKKEVQLARVIGHPNVCRVYELFEDSTSGESRWFLTMQLLEGRTLSTHLRTAGPIAGQRAARLLHHILRGIAAAHRLGIVHRDLKPGNIMLVHDDIEGERALIMDFGLAKRLLPGADDATRTHAILGTPAYMAPEQAAGKQATPPSDLYSFALTAVEMITGKRYEETSTCSPDWAVVERNSTHATARLLARCLQPNPADRYPSAVQALAEWENPAGTQLAHRKRKFRKPWTAVAGLCIAAVVFLVWGRNRTPVPTPEAISWYRDGLQSLAEGALVRAQRELEKSVQLAPGFAAAHAARAEAFLEMDMTAQARDAMLQASAAAPDRSSLPTSQALYLNGIQHLMLGECAPALQSLSKMADRSAAADLPAAVLIVARAAMRCNQSEDAGRALQRASQADSRNAAVPMMQAMLAARRRDYPAAEALLNSAADLFRLRDQQEGAGQVLYLRAVFLEEQNRLAEALAALEQATDIGRTSLNPLLRVRIALQKGLVLRQQGDMPQARAQTAEALQLAGQHGLDTLSLQALFAAGNLHLKRYELEDARLLFQRANEIATRFRNPEATARAQLSLASVFVRMGKPGEAIESAHAALPFYESAGQVRNVATVNWLLGQACIVKGDFLQAERIFLKELERAVSRKDIEREAIVRENLATALAELSKLSQALQHYEAAAEAHRKAGKRLSLLYALTNVSDVQSRLGRFSDAGKNLNQARTIARELEKSPAELHQRVEIGAAFNSLRSGDYRGAIAAARKSLFLKLPPNSFREAQSRGVICFCSAMTSRSPDLTDCDRAIAAARGAGRQSFRDAQLIAAFAYLHAGSPKQADAHAATVAEELDRSQSPEAAWMAYSIRAAASSRMGRPTEAEEFRRLASRQLEFLRNLISGPDFATWQRRADIGQLRGDGPIH